MKKIILFYCLLLVATVAQAQRVSVGTAKSAARNFFLKHTGQAATLERISFAGIQNIYIFNRSDADGFIIVAGDKNVRPVLVYSFDDTIDPENNPEAFATWLQSYDMGCEKPAANSKNQTLWNNLLTYSASAPTLLGEGEYIAPMVPCVWKQSSPYDMYCPDSAGVHAAAGCVPIAQAQIMRYWNFPKRAMGYESYFEPPYGILSTSFHTYDWANMFDTLRTTTTEEQKQNVAHLIADIGISGHSDYGPGETEGSFVLWTHFQYNPDSVRYEIKKNYTSAQWNAMVLEELRKGRPLLYVGMTLNSGHVFVVDGYKYNEDNGGDMFHFNMGWGGLANGYYYLDSANFGFTSQGAYLGLEPDSSIAISTPILLLPSNACDTTFVLRSDYRSSDAVNISVDHDWLSLSQTSALGGGEYTDVQISALQNTTEAKRYATITITHRGKTKKLYVVQDAPIYDAEYGWYGFFSAENTNTFYTKEQPGTEFIICPESFANFSAGQKIERICYHSFSTNDSITIKIYEDPHANWNYGLTTSGQSRYADTICGTLVYSQEYTSAQGGAHIIDLNTPYTITDKPFWIGIYNNSKSHIVNIANDEEVIFDQIEDKNVNASRFINNKSFLGKRADNVLFNIASTLQSYTNPENAGMSYKLVMNKYGISFYVGDGQTNISATANNTVYGTVSGGGKHNLGETVTLVATPKSGCRFLHWTSGGNIVSTDAELSLVAKHDTYLVAHFTDRDFTITAVSSDENRGTVSEIGYYDLNETVTLTATPTYGYQFDTWTCNGTVVSSEQTYTFPATGNATYTANFVPRTFTVTLSFEYNNNWGTMYGSGEYLYGETVTISAVAKENYVFECWISNNKEVSEDATYSFVITQDTTFYAGFIGTALSYTIIAGNGGTVYNEGTHRAVYGVYKLISATPNEGYKFVNWTSGETVVSNAASFRLKVEQDTVLTANFAKINYYVIETSATEGGTVTSGGTYEEGEYVTLVATPDNDCRFINWTVNGEIVSTKASYRFVASANATYVAHFVHYCEISATANNTVYGTVSGGGEYNLGETVTLVATPKSGCDFVNWTLDGTVLSTEASYTFTATANAALTANFTPGTFTVTLSGFNGNNEGGTLVGAGNFKYGDTVTVSAISDAMYEFAGWYNRNYHKESSQETYSFVLTQETTLIGYFNGIPLNYSVIAGNGGTVSTTGGSSRYKNYVTITATPNSGYRFVNWTSGNKILSLSESFRFRMEQDTIITANFADTAGFVDVDYCVISTSVLIGGSVSGVGVYLPGDTVNLVAIPDKGFKFISWKLGGKIVSTSEKYSFTASENANFIVNFEALPDNTVEIAATAGAGGSVSGAGTYLRGKAVSLIATPDKGFRFVNWTSKNLVVSTNAKFHFTANSNGDFTANFEAIPDSLMVTVAATAEHGLVSGAGKYQKGETVTLVATPDNGYKFVGWTANNTIVSVDASYSFTVSEDVNLIATFEAVPDNSVIVTATASAGGMVSGAGTYQKGETITLVATPDNGYKFVGWTANNTIVSVDASYSFTVSEDVNLIATFEAVPDNSVIVTATASAGGTVSGAGTYQKGETVTLVATPDKGYKFAGWAANNSIVSTSAEYSFTVEEAITIVANFMVDNDNTAIEETENNTFVIYPNPAATGFFVENAEGTVELFTLDGKRILATEVSGNAWISVVELKAGTYLVRCGAQVRTLVKK